MQKIQLSRILSRSQYRFPVHPFSSTSSPSSSPPALLCIGHVLRASRRFLDQDVARYTEVTGDYNPVHLDPEFAASVAGFERGRVVHGMLLASLFPSIIASHFAFRRTPAVLSICLVPISSGVRSVTVTALLARLILLPPGAVYASQDLKFKLPVYVGDEVTAQVQAINIKQMKKRYIVKFTTKCFTNEDRLMVDGEAVAVLPTLCLSD